MWAYFLFGQGLNFIQVILFLKPKKLFKSDDHFFKTKTCPGNLILRHYRNSKNSKKRFSFCVLKTILQRQFLTKMSAPNLAPWQSIDETVPPYFKLKLFKFEIQKCTLPNVRYFHVWNFCSTQIIPILLQIIRHIYKSNCHVHPFFTPECLRQNVYAKFSLRQKFFYANFFTPKFLRQIF